MLSIANWEFPFANYTTHLLLISVFQVNPERVVVYRVVNSSELFSNPTPALSSHTLSTQDRLGLQNEAFAMVR